MKLTDVLSPHGPPIVRSGFWGCLRPKLELGDRPHTAIARTRAFARGELSTAEEIRRRFVGGDAAGDVKVPAAVAAARAAGQGVAV